MADFYEYFRPWSPPDSEKLMRSVRQEPSRAGSIPRIIPKNYEWVILSARFLSGAGGNNVFLCLSAFLVTFLLTKKVTQKASEARTDMVLLEINIRQT